MQKCSLDGVATLISSYLPRSFYHPHPSITTLTPVLSIKPLVFQGSVCKNCAKLHTSCIKRQHLDLNRVSQVDMIELEEEKDSSKIDATEYLNNLNEQDTKRLKVIKLEFDVIEQTSGRVSNTLHTSYCAAI